jgi:exosortase/archaeosortase family protein
MFAFLTDKKFILFLVKFLVVFLVCYYGTIAIIGLSAEHGLHSPFVAQYLDYVSWIRTSLLYGSKWMLSMFGVDTYFNNEYNIRQVNGRGIVIVYTCVGYGIMSFWTAFVVASVASWRKKLIWWAAGISFFWILNVTRLSLLLVATNKNWAMPLGWDHHTWFNLIAYSVILGMIYFFEKSSGREFQDTGKNGRPDIKDIRVEHN